MHLLEIIGLILRAESIEQFDCLGRRRHELLGLDPENNWNKSTIPMVVVQIKKLDLDERKSRYNSDLAGTVFMVVSGVV